VADQEIQQHKTNSIAISKIFKRNTLKIFILSFLFLTNITLSVPQQPIPATMYPGDKRTVSDTAFSPRKESKKRKGMGPTKAESALDSEDLKAMIVDQKTLLSAIAGFVSEITDLVTEDTDPRKLVKVLLMEGRIEDKGMITNKDNELTLVWKEVKRFNFSRA
jgi:hypothetical protein